MKLENFDKLASGVEKLIARVEKLKKDRDELRLLIDQKDREISSLRSSTTQFDQEKATIKAKIDSLLAKIDEQAV